MSNQSVFMSSNSLSPEIEALTIVVIGKFNPAIFHPSWFSEIKIFSETEINQALKEFKGVTHRDISEFQFEWCNFVVEPNRLIASTKMDAYFERLRDVVLATFRELHHTPIHAVGINPEGDFKAPSLERGNEFGHRLAPKEDWKRIMDNPLLRQLIIEDSPRTDGYKGLTAIRIQPSEKKEIENGIFIHMNDHHSFQEDFKVGDGAKYLLQVLEEGFPNTMKKWKNIHQYLTSLI